MPYKKEDPDDNWEKKPTTIQGHAIEVINVCDEKKEIRTEIVKILVAQGMTIWDVDVKLVGIRGVGVQMQVLKPLFAATKVIDKISRNENL